MIVSLLIVLCVVCLFLLNKKTIVLRTKHYCCIFCILSVSICLLYHTSMKEQFTDSIIATTGNTANTSCNTYCATNTNNKITLNDSTAHSAVCIGTSSIVQPCTATNTETMNCFCATSDTTGNFTGPTTVTPITNIADITACKHLCDTNGFLCQGFSYNSMTQTCTLQSQLIPVKPQPNIATYTLNTSINNISPGPIILPIIWYTFNDYDTG